MPVREHPRLRFGPAQLATFAPLMPVLEAVACETGLELSRVFDTDPINPQAACFLNLETGWAWITVSALDPFTVCDRFRIDVHDRRPGRHRWWEYGTDEGPERLSVILAEALKVLESRQS